MKSLQFMTAILLFVVFTNCSNDDDNNTQPTTIATWNLTRVTGGIAGVDQTITPGLIKWTFNTETSTLIVVNNNTDDDIFDFYDSGTYSYSIENNGTDEILSINGTSFGAVVGSLNELTIDEQIDDGFVLTFTR